MDNLWSDKDARACVKKYAADGIDEDLALRVYTTRLLGGEPRLVLHGGGNTSVKTRETDLLGDVWPVLRVKGSGWDMAAIEPPGLPAVKLEPLQKARSLDRLSDEDMVALQRVNLIDPRAPNPSVETLLHAFLPHKFVDHTHSTAVLALSDQPDGMEICEEVFGPAMAIVPYVMPGFDLAKLAAQTYEAHPESEGLILHKHGIFTYGDTAERAYERMIRHVSRAEAYIAARPNKTIKSISLPREVAAVADVAPIVRGACALTDNDGEFARLVCEFRTSDQVRAYVDGEGLGQYGARGVTTPDLIIRVKNLPLILPPPDGTSLDGFKNETRTRAEAYCADYRDYFARNNKRLGHIKTMVAPAPRLVCVPGLGLFGLGSSVKQARVAADIGENIIRTVSDAERIGAFEPLREEDLFEMEYWSLEQAKLGKAERLPLEGQIAIVTGGAGAIGRATAELFAESGAAVAVLDIDVEAAQRVADGIGVAAMSVPCDVTDGRAVRGAFEQVAAAFGGLDIVVSNAGAALQGEIGALDDEALRESFELNFFAHQYVAKNAVRIMKLQDTGGALLFNVSKQAVNPGAKFGAYGLPKAAALFLSRQYALEYGSIGIRSNAVNADRIRSGILTEDMIAARAEARGLSEADYMEGNLLGREVEARHVARAFLDHALAARTTADVTTVDGGNIAAALR